jgi:Spy/CpxP family protein refolding chaperone
MQKRTLTAIAIAALIAITGAGVAAWQRDGNQPPQGPRGLRGPGPGGPMGERRGPGGPGFLFPGIELTDAQREQVKSITESHRDELQAVGTRLRDAHRAFAEATRATTPDEAAVRARAADVGNAMADEALLRGRIQAQVFAILTAEQQQQVNQRRSQMEQRLRGRGERRRP